MKTRYYSFFALLRMTIMNKGLYFSAPGNKVIERVLILLRERGLIAGFVLDFDRSERKKHWDGYPRYKVFIKYSYFGYPVIKEIKMYKSTKTNFTELKIKKANYLSRLENNNYYLVNSLSGIKLMNNNEFIKLPIDIKLLAKFKV